MEINRLFRSPYSLIKNCYSDEEDIRFFTQYHKKGGNLKGCIEDAVKSLEKSIVYEVWDSNHHVAGYFAREEADGISVMTGFYVKKEHRNPEFLREFWSRARKEIGREFLIGIYCKNEPALLHLLKNGFTALHVGEQDGQVFITLKSSY